MPSTVIRSFEYNAETRELRIIFRSGRRYVYRDVPPDMHAAMKSAFSKGVFFNEHIRDRFKFAEEE
jgi:hypothetical protein